MSRTRKKEKEEDRIDWRRGKVQQLNSQGYSQREIAQILQISNGTVKRPINFKAASQN
jgi:transposase